MTKFHFEDVPWENRQRRNEAMTKSEKLLDKLTDIAAAGEPVYFEIYLKDADVDYGKGFHETKQRLLCRGGVKIV